MFFNLLKIKIIIIIIFLNIIILISSNIKAQNFNYAVLDKKNIIFAGGI